MPGPYGATGTIGPIQNPGIIAKALRGYGDLLNWSGVHVNQLGDLLGSNQGSPKAAILARVLRDSGQGLQSSGEAIHDWGLGFSPIRSTPSGGWANPTVDRKQLVDIALGMLPVQSVAKAIPGAAKDAASDMMSAQLRGMPRVTAYHGSPHDFERFDLSKVGTGEGAQAYGHGLYFSENPDVARTYQSVAEPAYRNAGVRSIVSDAMNDAAKMNLSGNDARLWARNRITQQAMERPAYSRQQWFDAANNIDSIIDEPVGRFYSTDIPDKSVARMIDWDRPLMEQPNVAELFKQKILPMLDTDSRSLAEADMSKLNGSGFMTYVNRALGSDDAASRFLNQNGIPGIKYLDYGSRDAGAGTYNYVVFDQNLPKIIKKE